MLQPSIDRLISRGKPAAQSSVSEWSRAPTAQEDAAGALDGKIDGTRKFHTALEQNPWWQVDLLKNYKISEVRIHNTCDATSSRFKNFSLSVSIDGEVWAEITRKDDDIPVELDCNPYIWRELWPAWGRFVRVTLLGPGFLHLDQVEVYTSEPAEAAGFPISKISPADKINPNGDTTVVITSCNRHDLLEQTLHSFERHNTYNAIKEIIVVEDGDANPEHICARYGARLIRINPRRGQLHAIDVVYSHVKTPYIFHCEDDWEFYRPGFIEKSMEILKSDLSCVCVWLRAWRDTNGHPLSFRARCKTFGVLAYGYLNIWHGFSWNPGLRRKSDYDAVGPFSHIFNHADDLDEPTVSERYAALGYRAVILDEGGYVRHLGWERHIAD